jgi:hypothetical protein
MSTVQRALASAAADPSRMARTPGCCVPDQALAAIAFVKQAAEQHHFTFS